MPDLATTADVPGCGPGDVRPRVVLGAVECATAREFLDAISPLGPYFEGARPGDPWLFRGQGGDWPLIPSALRAEGKTKLAALTGRKTDIPAELRLAERDVLIRFFEIADRRGLVLPDDSQVLRSMLATYHCDRGDQFIRAGNSEWVPAREAMSLVALAQHYGIPTRLLDWTRLPLIAAYFAAVSACSRARTSPTRVLDDGGTDRMVVWSFHFPMLGRQDPVHFSTDPVRIVTAPAATNPNLKAQQGLFSYVNPVVSEWQLRPFEELTNELPHHEAVTSSTMRKFTLPILQADDLLRLLAKMDITPSSVFPGYQSIINDLEHRAGWAD